MDVISHIIITRKLVGKERDTLIAGVFADAPFYLTYPTWLIATKQFRQSFANNDWPDPPEWMKTSHYIFHSLPVALFTVLLVRIITGKWQKKFLLSWVLHILIDIPTHSRRQWGPQFLWPFSEYVFDGISWVEAAILIYQKVGKRKR